MRKIIYAQIVSPDGFCGRPNRKLAWSKPGPVLLEHVAKATQTGVLLLESAEADGKKAKS